MRYNVTGKVSMERDGWQETMVIATKLDDAKPENEDSENKQGCGV